MFVLYEFLGRRSFIDPICCNSCMVLSMLYRLVLASSLTSTWNLDSCPPEDTWYGVILWVLLNSSGSGIKSECADIFHQSLISGCYGKLTNTKEGETAVYGYNPAQFRVLSVWCWCLADLIFTYYDQHCSILLAELNMSTLIFFANQVFIDPTFFGIFVCGPLQSLVVNVCTPKLVKMPC